MQPYAKKSRSTSSEPAVSALAPQQGTSEDFPLSATPFHFFSQVSKTADLFVVYHLSAGQDGALQWAAAIAAVKAAHPGRGQRARRHVAVTVSERDPWDNTTK